MAFRRYSVGGVTDHPIEPLEGIRRSAQIGPDTSADEVAAEGKRARQDYEKKEAITAYTRRRRPGGDRKPAVRAEQIMSTPVVSIEPDLSLDEARKIVQEKRFRHVPVVTNDGKVLGVVSDRDLFAMSSWHDDDPADIVADIMSKDVLTATPNTGIREIARVLFEERIGCMPIVDDEGKVVGMITRSDILRALIKHAPFDLWI